MVAAVCAWHEHHERAAAELNRRLAARQTMIVAAPALVETYAVLTRLPPPHRLSPSDALHLIDANFAGAGRIVALDGRGYVALIRRSSNEGVAGGRVYDAIIAQCAVKGGAVSLLTFNAAHFASFAAVGLEVVVP
jgi:predicted nucleic acid-binding protein